MLPRQALVAWNGRPRSCIICSCMDSFAAGVIFGIIGGSYFMYGRKTHNVSALVAGVLLCVFPYFVDGLLWTMIVGTALMAAPFFISL